MDTTARAALLGGTGTALSAVAAGWLARAAGSWWPGTGPVQVESGLAFLAVGAASVLALWASVVLGAATLSLWSSASTPPGERRLSAPAAAGPAAGPAGRGLTGRVAAGLLVAAGLGATPVAAADPGVPPAVVAVQPGTCPAALADAPEGEVQDDLPTPGWTPTVTRAEPVRAAPGEVGLVSTAAGALPSAGDEEAVVVRRGDTLWGIAARHLGPHATDQDVAEAWPRWHAANRDVIGADPDLIRPGQLLVRPADGGAR